MINSYNSASVYLAPEFSLFPPIMYLASSDKVCMPAESLGHVRFFVTP